MGNTLEEVGRDKLGRALETLERSLDLALRAKNNQGEILNGLIRFMFLKAHSGYHE